MVEASVGVSFSILVLFFCAAAVGCLGVDYRGDELLWLRCLDF